MGWTKEYWEKNGKRIVAERKKRYHTDPEYRQKALDRAKAYRERKRKENAGEIETPELEVAGVKTAALTSKQLCDLAGIDKARLKYMQRVNYVPMALVTHPVRLYTTHQCKLVTKLEAYLRANEGDLRTPQTPSGAKAKEGLEALVSTIHNQWEKLHGD